MKNSPEAVKKSEMLDSIRSTVMNSTWFFFPKRRLSSVPQNNFDAFYIQHTEEVCHA